MKSAVNDQGLLARLALVLYFLVGLLPGGDFVLCIDGDGCLAIEAATEAGSCSDCTESAPCSDPGGEAAGTGCDCIDLVITGSEEREQTVPRPSFQPAAPGVAVTLRAEVELAPHRTSSLRREPPRPPGALAALRTVVLLV